MIFKILISIVFISEIIITLFLMIYLFNLNKKVLALNDVIEEAGPKIKEISNLCTKISKQMVEFSQLFADKIQEKKEDFIYNHVGRIILTMFVWNRLKLFNKIKRLKIFRSLKKGLSLLQIVL